MSRRTAGAPRPLPGHAEVRYRQRRSEPAVDPEPPVVPEPMIREDDPRLVRFGDFVFLPAGLEP